ncbi:uncharacterized protein LOC110032859 isoform X2 [Phalaenopsis equestris]|uniref:uncharacterized protein LOC110032859 isoform X2 n=1 Tax=Phalaenopsis equestris TaxID=78828 RepID=UPI0009E2E5C6|nr:uncharacterized protein LOC110032859 isoform X2 [Phalaenopsis equestris]
MKDMEAMASYYQAATLVALPSYPNSLVWSKENLVAIPSEHLITILNPASLSSARGVITLVQNKPFRTGLVERSDLLTPCLQPICLSKDTRPCARSISWSPPGLAPNSGCLLAVCTFDGHVKLYRAPYCEYSSEWIEVADMSDLLFDHITTINYGKWNDQSLAVHGVKASSRKRSRSKNGFAVSTCNKSYRSIKRKGPSCRRSSPTEVDPDIISLGICYGGDGITLEDNEANAETDDESTLDQSSNLPHITAQQYVSRSAVLSSLVVSWSPVLQSSETCCAILSAGAKSGDVSFWRICEPECFTIKHGNIPVNAMLIGLIQAHNSWITAICFGISTACSLKSQLFMVTGCSDGSVKIWSGNVEGFLLATDVRNDCFLLLAEVKNATSVSVSTIALVIPITTPEEVVLAIGRGAGMLDVWIYDISSKKLRFVANCNAHEQVVTGLAWAFDGACLYSCSQDNSIRRWIFRGDSLCEAPLSSNSAASEASNNNLSSVSDLCFGLALSPGEQMVAMVHSFDANLQHQMYEKRSQRAVVEFFWSGGQSFEVPNDSRLDGCRFEAISCLSVPEFTCWEINTLGFLKSLENVNKPIVIWDTLTLLRNLRKDFPVLVENMITKWISSWFSGPVSDSLEAILFRDQDKILMVSSRKIQLLNIICRRVMLSEMGIDSVKDYQFKHNRSSNKGSNSDSWNDLLIKSEGELQERLVAFSFQVVLKNTANSQSTVGESAYWSPVGLAQMERWTAINDQKIHSQLRLLGSEVAECRSRNNIGISQSDEEESCSFCSAPVPFESFEVAFCEGIVNQKGCNERHQLTRCAVSMRLCSVTEPLWHCMCCRRWAANLLPRSFFMLQNSPLYFRNVRTFSAVGERVKPLCPFCGILLQRSMPDFLLSTSLV